MKCFLLCAILMVVGCATKEPPAGRTSDPAAPPMEDPPPSGNTSLVPSPDVANAEMAFHPDDLKPFLLRLGSELQGLDEDQATRIHRQIMRLKRGERTSIEVPVQFEGVKETLKVTASMGGDRSPLVRFSMEDPAAVKRIERMMDQ